MYISGVNISKIIILALKTCVIFTAILSFFLLIPISKSIYSHITTKVEEIYSTRIVVGETPLSVRIADTEEARIMGLSNTEKLDSDEALFFIFEKPDYHGIWMKDMFYSIDIIWINEKMEVVHIEQSISPNTYPKVFKPLYKALYVLETNAGFVKKHGIKVGDFVTKL